MSRKINNKSLKDSLKGLERRRVLRVLRWLPLFLFVCYVIYACSIILDLKMTGKQVPAHYWMIVCLLLPLVWLFSAARTSMHERYRVTILPEIIEGHRPDINYKSEGQLAGKYFAESKLYFGKHTRIDIRHQITGRRENMAYSIAQFSVKLILKISAPAGPGIQGGITSYGGSYFGVGNREYSGIRFTVSRKAPVAGHVLILPLLEDVKDTWDEKVVHNMLSTQKLPKFSQYFTGDIHFAKHFMVFTNSEEAAERLLTEELKQTVLETRKYLDKSASFAFKNKHMYIHASKREPMFDTKSVIPFDENLVAQHQKELDHYIRVVERFVEVDKPLKIHTH